MCDKSAQTTYLCNKCPIPAKPSSLNNGTCNTTNICKDAYGPFT